MLLYYKADVENNEGGTVSGGSLLFLPIGMTYTFRFTPDAGYEVADVIVNGESVGNVEKYTTDGMGNVDIKVVFEPAVVAEP